MSLKKHRKVETMQSFLLMSSVLLTICSHTDAIQQKQSKEGTIPETNAFKVSESDSVLWRLSLSVKDCPSNVSIQAIVTVPDVKPEGATFVMAAAACTCPAYVTLCSNLWKNSSSTEIRIHIVGEKGIRYRVELENIENREILLGENKLHEQSTGTIDLEGKFSHDLFFFKLENVSGQVEIAAEADDVNRELRGRKLNRMTKEAVPRFVARLVVGNACLSHLDYRAAVAGSKSKLRSHMHLTFSTFGKITLSRNSNPSLRPGTWYVGVYSTEREFDQKDLTKKDLTKKNFRLTVIQTPTVSDYKFLFPLIIIPLATAIFFIVIERGSKNKLIFGFDFRHHLLYSWSADNHHSEAELGVGGS
jgi:hypothetical protein